MLTIESVMLVHDWHNHHTCRLTVLSSQIRKLHAGQGQGAVHIRLAAGSDIYDKNLIGIKNSPGTSPEITTYPLYIVCSSSPVRKLRAENYNMEKTTLSHCGSMREA